ncbi:MAG: nucleotidyltransferase domain-containing protein [Chloroflexota bacterium]
MSITLSVSLPNEHLQTLLESVIIIYEAAFPERVRGYYVVGSMSSNTAIPNSDIDMYVLFKGDWQGEEQARQAEIKAGCRGLSPVHLDLPAIAEADLAHYDTVALKLGSTLVYGEDTRAEMPLPTMDTYLRWITGPVQRGLTYRFRQEQVSLPLSYPDASDNYYGYIPSLYLTTPAPLKYWAVHVGWLATFRVVTTANVYVPAKSALLSLYQAHVADEFTELIETVLRIIRQTWHYELPQHEADRAILDDAFQRTLVFENAIAKDYVAYLQQMPADYADIAHKRLAGFNRNIKSP